jgi:hypothetical protein
VSHAVRYPLTYGIALLILLTFVYVAIEQTVRTARERRERRAATASPVKRDGTCRRTPSAQIIEA